MCVVRMCACMSCIHMSVHVDTIVDVGNHSLSSFCLTHWGSISQSNPELADMVSLASQLALRIPTPSEEAGVTGSCSVLLVLSGFGIWTLILSHACVVNPLTTELSPQPLHTQVSKSTYVIYTYPMGCKSWLTHISLGRKDILMMSSLPLHTVALLSSAFHGSLLQILHI